MSKESSIAIVTYNVSVLIRHCGNERRFTSKELNAVIYNPNIDSVTFFLKGASATYQRSATEITYSIDDDPPKS